MAMPNAPRSGSARSGMCKALMRARPIALTTAIPRAMDTWTDPTETAASRGTSSRTPRPKPEPLPKANVQARPIQAANPSPSPSARLPVRDTTTTASTGSSSQPSAATCHQAGAPPSRQSGAMISVPSEMPRRVATKIVWRADSSGLVSIAGCTSLPTWSLRLARRFTRYSARRRCWFRPPWRMWQARLKRSLKLAGLVLRRRRSLLA